MVTGFWQVFALLGHLGFATVLTAWPNDFGRHPRLIRAIGILVLMALDAIPKRSKLSSNR